MYLRVLDQYSVCTWSIVLAHVLTLYLNHVLRMMYLTCTQHVLEECTFFLRARFRRRCSGWLRWHPPWPCEGPREGVWGASTHQVHTSTQSQVHKRSFEQVHEQVHMSTCQVHTHVYSRVYSRVLARTNSHVLEICVLDVYLRSMVTRMYLYMYLHMYLRVLAMLGCTCTQCSSTWWVHTEYMYLK
jgi:hypothetical protein